MKSRIKYVVAVLVLIAIVLLLPKAVAPETVRYQQHLDDHKKVNDQNLSIDAQTFSSHLPVVSITTGGQVIPGKPDSGLRVSSMADEMIQAEMKIWDDQKKLNTLSDQPAVDSEIQIRVRGNSSRMFDKLGYLVKFTDSEGAEKKVGVMGMERESTWIMHAPYLDKTLMRNYMWYNLSGKIMDWAPNVRYCEVFLNGSYQGVYVMEEQISRGDGRLQLTKKKKKIDISSYLICVDRPSVNDGHYLDNFLSYTKRMQGSVEVRYPGKASMTPGALEYISRDLSRFEKALYSYDYTSRRYGYEKYIDVSNFVDYFLINEITQNTDAGLFSTYVYKDVAGKLKMCVWDFNNSVDNYVEDQTPMAGFFMQSRMWYYMLCKDPKFVDNIIERYRFLRKGIFANENIKKYIVDVRSYLGPAIERNYEVWGYSFEEEYDLMPEERKIDSYEHAVEQYERRLISRLDWMDDHIDDLRSYSHESFNKKYND